MGFFITEQEIARLRTAQAGSVQRQHYDVLLRRVRKNSVAPALVQPGDTQDWYHLCWERLADASFAWAMEGEEALGRWVHDRTMEIVRRPPGEWLGPWFRPRGEVLIGALETSHITLAVCEAYENAAALFSAQEQCEIRAALRDKGMELCRRFCARTVEQRGNINNWFMVLLNGMGTAALVLGEEDAIRQAHAWSKVASSLYSSEDYGESVQYSNYATIHLSHLNEMFLRSGQYTPDQLAMQGYTGLMKWYAASYLHQKPLEGFAGPVPRAFNFNDSTVLFRPSGDVLAHVGIRMAGAAPRESALAAWLLRECYRDCGIEYDELATFGFFNQFGYHTVLTLPDIADAKSPEECGLPLAMSFPGGQIILRDRWEKPRATVAIQGGYQPYQVTSHRHRDQNSFQLVIDGERMLIDPGHCCYRLKTHACSTSALAHNTIALTRDGKELAQRSVGGNIFASQEAGNRLLENRQWGECQIIASDMAGLFDDSVSKAVRIWVMRLPNVMFVIDRIVAESPVALSGSFWANNRDNLLCANRATEQRLVLRRDGRALKLFSAWAEADGKEYLPSLEYDWGYAHTFYHPQPNQAGQGKEGSALGYRWKGPETSEQYRVYTLIADTSDDVKGWHVMQTQDGYTRIEPPEKKDWLDVKMESGKLLIRHPEQGTLTLL